MRRVSGPHYSLVVAAALLAGVAAALIAWALMFKELRGSGSVVTERRQVSGFDKIYFRSGGALRVTQGETESLAIEADHNLLPFIESKVENGELRIRLWHRGGVARISPTRLDYSVTVKQLRGVIFSGGKLEVLHLSTDHLKIEISGSAKAELTGLTAGELNVIGQHWGSISVSGAVQRLAIVLYGATVYGGAGLDSTTASLDIHHSAQATVRVRDRLDVTILDQGGVTYLGSPPAVQAKVSERGSLRQSPSQ